MDRKIMEDAIQVGKKYLTGRAIKCNSPERFSKSIFQKEESPIKKKSSKGSNQVCLTEANNPTYLETVKSNNVINWNNSSFENHKEDDNEKTLSLIYNKSRKTNLIDNVFSEAMGTQNSVRHNSVKRKTLNHDFFEDSRNRISKVTRLRRVIKELKGLFFNDKIKMFYQRNAFIYEGYCINLSKPWWCKIIAYILAFFFTFLSIFFIIIKAVSLGDFKTTKWLITVILGILFENILIEPIEVVNCYYIKTLFYYNFV